MSFTVDVHHHDAHNPVGGIAPPPWDADLMLSYMDEAGIADTLRRPYWDTALSYRDPILRMLRDVVGLDQVLFGYG